jgi:hypothetical protein
MAKTIRQISLKLIATLSRCFNGPAKPGWRRSKKKADDLRGF